MVLKRREKSPSDVSFGCLLFPIVGMGRSFDHYPVNPLGAELSFINQRHESFTCLRGCLW
jgi:hypothetical protein